MCTKSLLTSLIKDLSCPEKNVGLIDRIDRLKMSLSDWAVKFQIKPSIILARYSKLDTNKFQKF